MSSSAASPRATSASAEQGEKRTKYKAATDDKADQNGPVEEKITPPGEEAENRPREHNHKPNNEYHTLVTSVPVSVFCLCFSAASGLLTGGAFVITYVVVLTAFTALHRWSQSRLGRREPPPLEMYFARLPIAMTALAVALTAESEKAAAIGLGFFVIAALFCGAADADAWAKYRARKAGGGEQ